MKAINDSNYLTHLDLLKDDMVVATEDFNISSTMANAISGFTDFFKSDDEVSIVGFTSSRLKNFEFEDFSHIPIPMPLGIKIDGNMERFVIDLKHSYRTLVKNEKQILSAVNFLIKGVASVSDGKELKGRESKDVRVLESINNDIYSFLSKYISRDSRKDSIKLINLVDDMDGLVDVVSEIDGMYFKTEDFRELKLASTVLDDRVSDLIAKLDTGKILLSKKEISRINTDVLLIATLITNIFKLKTLYKNVIDIKTHIMDSLGKEPDVSTENSKEYEVLTGFRSNSRQRLLDIPITAEDLNMKDFTKMAESCNEFLVGVRIMSTAYWKYLSLYDEESYKFAARSLMVKNINISLNGIKRDLATATQMSKEILSIIEDLSISTPFPEDLDVYDGKSKLIISEFKLSAIIAINKDPMNKLATELGKLTMSEGFSKHISKLIKSKDLVKDNPEVEELYYLVLRIRAFHNFMNDRIKPFDEMILELRHVLNAYVIR